MIKEPLRGLLWSQDLLSLLSEYSFILHPDDLMLQIVSHRLRSHRVTYDACLVSSHLLQTTRGEPRPIASHNSLDATYLCCRFRMRLTSCDKLFGIHRCLACITWVHWPRCELSSPWLVDHPLFRNHPEPSTISARQRAFVSFLCSCIQ